MNETTEALLDMDLGIGQKYGKPYHYASVKHQLVLLGKFSGLEISPRTYFRRRKEMEEVGLIRRIRRHRRGKDGKFTPGSTIIMVLAKGFYHLARVLKKALKRFSFYRLPKMAHNMFNKTDYLSFVDKLRPWREEFIHQRMDAAVFRTA